MTDFPTLSYTSTIKIPTPAYTWSLKKVPFSGGAPLYKPLYRVLRPPGSVIKGYSKKLLAFVVCSQKQFLKKVWSCINEFSELKHIWISNRGVGGGADFRILGRNSPAVWNIVSVFHENLNLSNIWFDYDDSFYFGREIEISKQNLLKEFDDNSWKLNVNIRLPGDLGLWKHLLL